MKNNWIKCSERLPEIPEDWWRLEKPQIIVAKDGNVYIAHYCRSDGKVFGNKMPLQWVVSQEYDQLNYTVIEAVYWQYLPEAPKD